MRGRDFLDKMELVSPIYVEGADRIPIIRPKQWPKLVIGAACLCLVAWGAWGLTGGFGRNPGYVAGPGESEGLERAQLEVDGMTLEPCPGTLGFDQCWVRYDGTPDAANWWYYTDNGNGRYRLAAQSWWNAKSAAPYEADLDGDGVKELIFNLNYEDGFREIQIIRRRDGEVQNCYFDNAFLRDHWEEQGLTTLEGATEHIRSYYDPAQGIVLEADCYDAQGKEVLSVEVFQDLEHFSYFLDEQHRDRDPIDGEPLEEPSPQPSDEVASIVPEPCPATLGFENCMMIREESFGVTTWRFYGVEQYLYGEEDGQYRLIAETWDLGDEPDVYRVDLDGDGVDELVCNRAFADGGQDVVVYRNRDGQIERGWLDMDYILKNWSARGFTPIGGIGSVVSWFNPKLINYGHGSIEVEAMCRNEKQQEILMEEVFVDLEHIVFEPYDPATIPLGVATVKVDN